LFDSWRKLDQPGSGPTMGGNKAPALAQSSIEDKLQRGKTGSLTGLFCKPGPLHEVGGIVLLYLADTLHLRGSCDFASVEAYSEWLEGKLRQRNERRRSKWAEEREAVAPLPRCRLPEFEEVDCQVNKYSLVRVGKGSYSVPSKYRTRRLRARMYESRIELWNEQECVAAFERHANAAGACVDWRHLIEELCRKPGAFARYRYRGSFYPSPLWREVNDQLRERFSPARADSDYLQMLRLSLEHGMERMEELLVRLNGSRELTLDRVRRELGEQSRWQHCSQTIEADLNTYDVLLSGEVAHG